MVHKAKAIHLLPIVRRCSGSSLRIRAMYDCRSMSGLGPVKETSKLRHFKIVIL